MSAKTRTADKYPSNRILTLHDPWISDSVVRGRGAHAASRLLYDNSKNEAMINSSLGCYLLDRVVDGADLWTVVVSDAELAARVEHDLFVVVEPEVIREYILKSRRWLVMHTCLQKKPICSELASLGLRCRRRYIVDSCEFFSRLIESCPENL